MRTQLGSRARTRRRQWRINSHRGIHSSPEITTPVPPPCEPNSIPGLDRTTPSIRLESLSSSNGIEDSGKRTVFVLVIARVHLFNLTDRGALEQWDDMRPSMPPVATRATHRSRECETTIERVLWGTTSRCEEGGAQGREIERKCGVLRLQSVTKRPWRTLNTRWATDGLGSPLGEVTFGFFGGLPQGTSTLVRRPLPSRVGFYETSCVTPPRRAGGALFSRRVATNVSLSKLTSVLHSKEVTTMSTSLPPSPPLKGGWRLEQLGRSSCPRAP